MLYVFIRVLILPLQVVWLSRHVVINFVLSLYYVVFLGSNIEHSCYNFFLFDYEFVFVSCSAMRRGMWY